MDYSLLFEFHSLDYIENIKKDFFLGEKGNIYSFLDFLNCRWIADWIIYFGTMKFENCVSFDLVYTLFELEYKSIHRVELGAKAAKKLFR